MGPHLYEAEVLTTTHLAACCSDNALFCTEAKGEDVENNEEE